MIKHLYVNTRRCYCMYNIKILCIYFSTLAILNVSNSNCLLVTCFNLCKNIKKNSIHSVCAKENIFSNAFRFQKNTYSFQIKIPSKAKVNMKITSLTRTLTDDPVHQQQHLKEAVSFVIDEDRDMVLVCKTLTCSATAPSSHCSALSSRDFCLEFPAAVLPPSSFQISPPLK